ncbi:MAG: hypothetical protein ACI4LS_11630 [Treponema sp.]
MAEIKPQQTLLPIQIFIGDNAELNCSFSSNDEFLSLLISKGQTQLSSENFVHSVDDKEIEITDICILQTGMDYYQIKIHFKPWKTGRIQFPPIKIGETIVKFEPINISSLSEEFNESSIQNTAPPLLLPYTSYIIGGIIFSSLIISLAIIFIAIKRKQLLFYFKNLKLRLRYKKNKKITMNRLRGLQKIENDKAFVQEYQMIMRKYLENRFDFPFTRNTTSQFSTVFLNNNKDFLSSQTQEAFFELITFFIRTDYIKYNANKHFLENEKQEILEKTVTLIYSLEKNEVQCKEDAEYKSSLENSYQD